MNRDDLESATAILTIHHRSGRRIYQPYRVYRPGWDTKLSIFHVRMGWWVMEWNTEIDPWPA